MKLLVDANIIISALIKDSKVREILTEKKFEFISPDFILEDYLLKKGLIDKRTDPNVSIEPTR